MRLVPVDLLRSVAVLLVMVRHLGEGKNNPAILAWLEKIQAAPFEVSVLDLTTFRLLYRCGWMGVDLFFVLSGFLVSGLLFREYQRHGVLAIGRFLVRRALKIYPAFYVFLTASVLAIVVATDRDIGIAAIVSEVLFVQNYGPNVWGHSWSLAVEEHFYLLLAGSFYILGARAHQRSAIFASLPRVFVLVAALALAMRLSTGILHPEFEHKIHVFPTHLRIDSLLFGVLLSYYHHFEPARLAFARNWRWLTLVVSLALIAPALFLEQGTFFMRTFGLTMLFVGFGGVLLVSLAWPTVKRMRGGLFARVLLPIGLNSYSIYLWHMPILVVGVPLASRILHRPSLGLVGELAIYAAGSLMMGITMAKIVEWPVLRLRDRLFPSRSGGLAAKSAA